MKRLIIPVSILSGSIATAYTYTSYPINNYFVSKYAYPAFAGVYTASLVHIILSTIL